jgi:hypothetical protein
VDRIGLDHICSAHIMITALRGYSQQRPRVHAVASQKVHHGPRPRRRQSSSSPAVAAGDAVLQSTTAVELLHPHPNSDLPVVYPVANARRLLPSYRAAYPIHHCHRRRASLPPPPPLLRPPATESPGSLLPELRPPLRKVEEEHELGPT